MYVKNLTMVLVAAILLGASTLSAAPLVCGDVTVEGVDVRPNNRIVVAELTGVWGTEKFIICSMKDVRGLVEPELCADLKNVLIAALVAKRSVEIISDEVTGPATCLDWTDYEGHNWPLLYDHLHSLGLKAEAPPQS